MIKTTIASIVAVSVLLTLSACSGFVKRELALPGQDIRAVIPDGHSRVVFYNDSFFSGVGSKIGIKINNKGLVRLPKNRYVQVFLPQGKYDLYLDHFDLLLFDTNHTLNITEREVFIEVYARPISTQYKIVDRLPENFLNGFEPIQVGAKK